MNDPKVDYSQIAEDYDRLRTPSGSTFIGLLALLSNIMED